MTSFTGELIEERRNHRRAVIRQAVMYTPAAIGVLVLLSISLRSVLEGHYGALIAGTILLLVEIALVYQAVAALRDLAAQPKTTTGMIRRAWSKGMVLGFIRSHYFLVDRAVFDVSVVTYSLVSEGDEVEIRHWPHTKSVIEVRKLKGNATADTYARAFEPKRDDLLVPNSTGVNSRDGRLRGSKPQGTFWRRWRK